MGIWLLIAAVVVIVGILGLSALGWYRHLKGEHDY
jgi:Tfp pilus assembly protein PilV